MCKLFLTTKSCPEWRVEENTPSPLRPSTKERPKTACSMAKASFTFPMEVNMKLLGRTANLNR